MARRSAADEWISIINQMRHLVFCSPDEIPVRFIDLSPTRSPARRQCTKERFDGRPLHDAQLAALHQAGIGNSVRTLIFTDAETKRIVTDFVNQDNRVQLSDPDW